MKFYGILAFLAVAVSGLTGFSHDRFILPSHTQLSGDEGQSISLISSISNDIFHPDRPHGDNGRGVVPPNLKGLFQDLKAPVILPDGTVVENQTWQSFARLSAGDMKLEESGTYRICLIQHETPMITFKKSDGTGGRMFGKEAKPPEGATQVVTRTISSRVETFVTLNEPNREAVRPTGLGLELGGATHPNDLFVGEEASFQLYFGGKPLEESTSVQFIRGATRHRNQRNPISLDTDDRGAFNVSFKEPGFYLMTASVALPGSEGSGVKQRHFSLFLTLEVFPE